MAKIKKKDVTLHDLVKNFDTKKEGGFNCFNDVKPFKADISNFDFKKANKD